MGQFSVAEQGLLTKLRTLIRDDIEPLAAQRERDRQGCRALLPQAAATGLLGLQVPLASGGSAMSFACKVEAADMLAAADFGVAMSFINTHNVAAQIARIGSPRQVLGLVPDLVAGRKSACTALTEPGAGSDFAAIAMRATRTADGWVLNGCKTWIINAVDADLVVVYAQTGDTPDAAGIAAFVIDTSQPGFTRSANTPMGPLASMGVGGFTLDHFLCREDALLAAPGRAFKAILQDINGARVYVAAMCCGMVADCLQRASDYGKSRHTFGQPLHAHQGWRWQIADAAIDLDAARLMVQEAAKRIDAGADAQAQAARAKVFATRMAQRHIAALLHAMGAEGLHDRQPFLRHLAATQVAALADGSTEMLLERIALDVQKNNGPMKAHAEPIF